MFGKFETSALRGKQKGIGTGLFAGLRASALMGACVGAAVIPKDFQSGAVVQKAVVENWTLSNVGVQNPETMNVSTDPLERYPDSGQIGWYGDGPGDVKAQVANLITESVSHGVADMLVGEEPVELVITLRQFHALTPRARLSNLQLGVHEIVFDIEVRNERGDLIASEDGINADLRAFSGFKAYEAEVRGATQRKSIRQRVADVVRRWLAPWSFEKA